MIDVYAASRTGLNEAVAELDRQLRPSSYGGHDRCLCDEAMDLMALGPLGIRRSSHVEPDRDGGWLADFSPVANRFACRFPPLRTERSGFTK